MPVLTNHHALMALFGSVSNLPAIPWNFPAWQELTGIRHGLFPDDDNLLPGGWTREDATNIQSYFSGYNAKDTEAERIAYANGKGQQHNAAELWKTFVVQGFKKWKIQRLIEEAFAQSDCLITQYMVANELGDEIPQHVPTEPSFDRIAVALFGEHGLNNVGRVWHYLEPAVKTFALRAQQNMKMQVKRTIKRLRDNEAAIEALFDKLATGTPTRQQIGALVGLIDSWRRDVEIMKSEENVIKLSQMESELATIRSALGGEVDEELQSSLAVPSGKQKPKRFKASHFAQLAQSEDIEVILCMMEDHFSQPEIAETSCQQRLLIATSEFIPGGSGTVPESGMSYEHLVKNLALDNHGRTTLTAQYRRTDGLTAWTVEGRKAWSTLPASGPPPEPYRAVRMHWHQIVGVHACIRHIFSPIGDEDYVPGVLIADDVGLGKSFLAILFISFMIELGMRQSKHAALPPLIQQNPYLGSSKIIPNLPTVIAVPGTLTSQWWGELHTALKPNVVDLFLYPPNKPAQQAFWETWPKSKQELRHRIIVVGHQTIIQEYRRLHEGFSATATTSKHPFNPPRRRLHYDREVKKTLFGLQYLCVILDEAHLARNPGTLHCAAHLLLAQGSTRLVLTATPLQTRPEDVAAIGRLVGVHHFFTEAHNDEVNDNLLAIRRERTNNDGEKVRTRQMEMCTSYSAHFNGRIIRRTADSCDDQGRKLLTLPVKTEVDIKVKLTPRELEFIEDGIPDDALDQLGQAVIMGSTSGTFWCEERMATSWPAPATPRGKSRIPPPRFYDKEKWLLVKATKIDTVAQITSHMLSNDNALLPSTINGVLHLPEQPPLLAEPSNKVVIFQEYAFFTQLLQDVLALYEVHAIAINGSQSYQKRAAVVELFQKDPDQRCLIFSKIGSIGLNLTMANTMILMDPQWSQSDTIQTIGRIHQQTQTKNTAVFHVLAQGTVDYYMANLSRGKGALSDAFFAIEKSEKVKAKKKKVKALTSGDTSNNAIQVVDDDNKVGGREALEEQPTIDTDTTNLNMHSSRAMSAPPPPENAKGPGRKPATKDGAKGKKTTEGVRNTSAPIKVASRRPQPPMYKSKEFIGTTTDSGSGNDEPPPPPQLRNRSGQTLSTSVAQNSDDEPPLPPPRKLKPTLPLLTTAPSALHSSKHHRDSRVTDSDDKDAEFVLPESPSEAYRAMHASKPATLRVDTRVDAQRRRELQAELAALESEEEHYEDELKGYVATPNPTMNADPLEEFKTWRKRKEIKKAKQERKDKIACEQSALKHALFPTDDEAVPEEESSRQHQPEPLKVQRHKKSPTPVPDSEDASAPDLQHRQVPDDESDDGDSVFNQNASPMSESGDDVGGNTTFAMPPPFTEADDTSFAAISSEQDSFSIDVPGDTSEPGTNVDDDMIVDKEDYIQSPIPRKPIQKRERANSANPRTPPPGRKKVKPYASPAKKKAAPKNNANQINLSKMSSNRSSTGSTGTSRESQYGLAYPVQSAPSRHPLIQGPLFVPAGPSSRAPSAAPSQTLSSSRNVGIDSTQPSSSRDPVRPSQAKMDEKLETDKPRRPLPFGLSGSAPSRKKPTGPVNPAAKLVNPFGRKRRDVEHE